MFESPDTLIAESRFQEVAVIDSKSLTLVATTEIFVWNVNVIYLKNCLHN